MGIQQVERLIGHSELNPLTLARENLRRRTIFIYLERAHKIGMEIEEKKKIDLLWMDGK